MAAAAEGSRIRLCRIQAIIDRHFPPETHPYRVLEQTLLHHLEPGDAVLDIGCGRTAPNLLKLKRRAKTLIGLDTVNFEIEDPELTLLTGSVCQMSDIAPNSIDLAYSRSVMEHIEDVGAAYAEIYRIFEARRPLHFSHSEFLGLCQLDRLPGA